METTEIKKGETFRIAVRLPSLSLFRQLRLCQRKPLLQRVLPLPQHRRNAGKTRHSHFGQTVFLQRKP